MTITAKILEDSITDQGSRLITWELTYPRVIHSEIMTHGAFARNAASSRAIPTAKLRGMVENNPAMHVFWGANEKGMQASAEVADVQIAKDWWLRGMGFMTDHHAEGERLGLHKQIVNRVIEPWMNITVILSATDYANFFHLRNSEFAEPSFHELARQMWEAYHEHMPQYVAPGNWHVPMTNVQDEQDCYHLLRDLHGEPDSEDDMVQRFDETDALVRKVSVGRCARVSYLTHDGKRDVKEDIALHDRLATSGHWSPFEHVAQAIGGRVRNKKFEGWRQYRGFFENENGPSTVERCERCGCWGNRHVKTCPQQGASV